MRKLITIFEHAISYLALLLISIIIITLLSLTACSQDEIGCISNYSFDDNIQVSSFELSFIWTRNNIQYSLSDGSYYKTPEQTYNDKYGNCADLCGMTMYILDKYFGVYSYLVFVLDNTDGTQHSIIRIDNKYYEYNSAKQINYKIESGIYTVLDELEYCEYLWEVNDCHCLYTY